MKTKLKRDDTVQIVTGKDKGKTGRVLRVDSDAGKVIVQGLNMVKKALRKSQDNPQGGIVSKEAPVALSNLMLFCPNCKKGVRVRRTREGKQVSRACAACGHRFEG